MPDERQKVLSQRATVREHIDKWRAYPEEARNMALRTITNAQKFIARSRQRAVSITESWEDEWSPENDNDPREVQARLGYGDREGYEEPAEGYGEGYEEPAEGYGEGYGEPAEGYGESSGGYGEHD